MESAALYGASLSLWKAEFTSVSHKHVFVTNSRLGQRLLPRFPSQNDFAKSQNLLISLKTRTSQSKRAHKQDNALEIQQFLNTRTTLKLKTLSLWMREDSKYQLRSTS